MKIVLINPPVTNLILGNLPESITKEKEDPMPPLGLMNVRKWE